MFRGRPLVGYSGGIPSLSLNPSLDPRFPMLSKGIRQRFRLLKGMDDGSVGLLILYSLDMDMILKRGAASSILVFLGTQSQRRYCWMMMPFIFRRWMRFEGVFDEAIEMFRRQTFGAVCLFDAPVVGLLRGYSGDGGDLDSADGVSVAGSH